MKEEKGPWGQVGADGGTAGERKTTRDDTCNNCGRIGHWAKDYRLPPRHGGQAHVAQAEEQDATLFLAHGCVDLQQDTWEGVKGPSFPLSGSASSAEL